MTDPSRILASLRGSTAVALAEIDPAGRLLDANAGFIRLLPESTEREALLDVACYLVSPTFPQLLELCRSGREPSYEGLLTIGDPIGRSRTLCGAVTPRGESLLLVAAFMTPAMLTMVADRRFPLMARKHGGSFLGSGFGALWATVAALVALLV